jgi:hypothetical protein
MELRNAILHGLQLQASQFACNPNLAGFDHALVFA